MGWYQAKFVPNVFKNRSTQEDIYIFSLTISTTCGSNKYKRIIPSLNALTGTNVFKGTKVSIKRFNIEQIFILSVALL